MKMKVKTTGDKYGTLNLKVTIIKLIKQGGL